MDSVSCGSLFQRGNKEGNAHVSWFTSKRASILAATNEMKPEGRGRSGNLQLEQACVTEAL